MILVNPVRVKALQGRESDQRDSRRIAEFLQDGRLDGSFVPPRPIRELRILMRHRVSLLEQRNEVHNQIRDLLETACIKLSSVASDLMGVTGLLILRAMADGQTSPERLSWKARGSLRRKEKEIKEAVRGDFSEFHRRTLRLYLQHYDLLNAQIAEFEAFIGIFLFVGPGVYSQTVAIRNVSYPGSAIEAGNYVEIKITGASLFGTVTVSENGQPPFNFGSTNIVGMFSITNIETTQYIGSYNQIWYVNGTPMTPVNPDPTYLPWAPTLPTFEVFC